ncbi:MAG: SRPBCC family protein [Paracoccus sp. (in: a-proteobacteria)]|nr:SRPBCC family protein [Paracoccus sp. (in: a-proteobacteria)]
MKFSTRQDRDIPAAQMFDAVADFDRIERMLLRRGIETRRRAAGGDERAGWDVAFDWRGSRREVKLDLVQFDRPERIALDGRSQPLDMEVVMSVIPLAKAKSRLTFELDVRPRNMRARLMLQTAKLGKAALQRKFNKRIGEFLDGAIAAR